MSYPTLSDPIRARQIRELHLSHPAQSGRPSFISAASGLVATDDHLYVVADDELSLGVFARRRDAIGALRRLLPGELPVEPKPRKKAKPDFENLLQVPPFGACPHGALFAMGSGSTARRCRGVLLPFAADGQLADSERIIDLAEFFAVVADHVGTVNVEGGFFAARHFVILQRGNKGDGVNALVAFAASEVLEALARTDRLGPLPPSIVRRYELGSVRGVPFGFTDGTPLHDGGFVFSAIAEDTTDAIADGACVGSAIGIIDAEGTVTRLHPLHEGAKVEGVHAAAVGDRIELLLVTDADDPAIPARLLSATLTAS